MKAVWIRLVCIACLTYAGLNAISDECTDSFSYFVRNKVFSKRYLTVLNNTQLNTNKSEGRVCDNINPCCPVQVEQKIIKYSRKQFLKTLKDYITPTESLLYSNHRVINRAIKAEGEQIKTLLNSFPRDTKFIKFLSDEFIPTLNTALSEKTAVIEFERLLDHLQMEIFLLFFRQNITHGTRIGWEMKNCVKQSYKDNQETYQYPDNIEKRQILESIIFTSLPMQVINVSLNGPSLIKKVTKMSSVCKKNWIQINHCSLCSGKVITPCFGVCNEMLKSCFINRFADINSKWETLQNAASSSLVKIMTDGLSEMIFYFKNKYLDYLNENRFLYAKELSRMCSTSKTNIVRIFNNFPNESNTQLVGEVVKLTNNFQQIRTMLRNFNTSAHIFRDLPPTICGQLSDTNEPNCWNGLQTVRSHSSSNTPSLRESEPDAVLNYIAISVPEIMAGPIKSIEWGVALHHKFEIKDFHEKFKSRAVTILKEKPRSHKENKSTSRSTKVAKQKNPIKEFHYTNVNEFLATPSSSCRWKASLYVTFLFVPIIMTCL